jgi:tetratricopeptide (TPR) repeat protein
MSGRLFLALGVAAVLLAGVSGAGAQDVQAGINLYSEGKYAEAEAQLRAADGTDAKAYLAATLAKQKKYAEAESTARAILAVEATETHPVAVAAVGNALVGQKKSDEAVKVLSAAIAKNPGLAYAFFWRAQAYDALKQTPRMVADYEAFLKLAPDAPEAAPVKATLATLR